MQQLKGSDTSTAESGSEAEDIASPKASRSFSQVRLTPVREEVILSIKLNTDKKFQSAVSPQEEKLFSVS